MLQVNGARNLQPLMGISSRRHKIILISLQWNRQVPGFQSKSWWRHQMETFSALLFFVRGIHRSPVNSPHKGQWRRALMFSLICTWTHNWANNGDDGDLRHHRAHYDVIVMCYAIAIQAGVLLPLCSCRLVLKLAMSYKFMLANIPCKPSLFCTRVQESL